MEYLHEVIKDREERIALAGNRMSDPWAVPNLTELMNSMLAEIEARRADGDPSANV